MKLPRLLLPTLAFTLLLVMPLQAQNVIRVTEGVNKIDDAVFEAQPGDIIELVTNGGIYREEISVLIDKPVTIRANDTLLAKPIIISDDGSRMFDLQDDLTIQGVILNGYRGADTTSSGIRTGDGDLVKAGYNLIVEDCIFMNFDSAIRGGTDTFANLVRIRNSHFQNTWGRAIRFRDPVPPPVRFELENVTIWNSEGEAVYVDNIEVEGMEGVPEVFVNQVTIHNGADRAIYPRAFENAEIRNTIITDDSPGDGRAVRIYGESILEHFLYHSKPDGIQLSAGASIDSSKVLVETDPMYLSPLAGNFRLQEGSPAIGFGSEGQPLGDSKWWPSTQPRIEIDGNFWDWELLTPIEDTEPQVDPAIPDTFEMKAVWVAADDEKLALRIDFFGDGNPAVTDTEGPTNVNQGWHRVLVESADRLQRYRIRTYQGGSGSGDPVNFTRNRIRPEWRGDGDAVNRGESDRMSGMVAWTLDGRSMEMYVPWDSLWVLNPDGDTLRIERGDEIRVRFHLEAGGDGVGKNFLPAGEGGNKLDAGGGYYTVIPGQYDLTPTSSHSDDWLAREIPDTYLLNQNYPNPFNPATKIEYALPEAKDVRVTVFDVLGRHVATLVDGFQTAGPHSVRFDASHLSSGTYFYRLEAGSVVETRTMILLK